MSNIKSEDRITSDNYYRKTEDKFNCAQSILKGFQKEFNISDEEIKSFAGFGHGKAENGLCGAVYAAEYLLKKAGKMSIKEEFAEKFGSVYCKEMDKKNTKCSDRVLLADILVKKRIS